MKENNDVPKIYPYEFIPERKSNEKVKIPPIMAFERCKPSSYEPIVGKLVIVDPVKKEE